MPLICTLGDAVLDVVVRLQGPLAEGDDVPASTSTCAGGQAANVAAWTAALGARSRCIAKRGDDAAAALVAGELSRLGVELVGPLASGRSGVVVSLVGADGERTMASDRGAGGDFPAEELDAAWLHGVGWLHISGYTLATESRVAERATVLARAAGGRVSIDLSAVSVIESFGAARFLARLQEIGPELIFATESERAALGGVYRGRASWVVKHGADGFELDGDAYAALPVEAVDTTGAGDALAAGFLFGGPEFALRAAASCVQTVGAMPAGALT